MSDTESTSETSSFGDNSVCEEIGQLIERCEELHEYIHNSYETLQSIHSLVANKNNINVTHNEWTGDFEELLEVFHKEALMNISEGRDAEFGQKLLKMLDEAIFD
jgi:hypothetical protein